MSFVGRLCARRGAINAFACGQSAGGAALSRATMRNPVFGRAFSALAAHTVAAPSGAGFNVVSKNMWAAAKTTGFTVGRLSAVAAVVIMPPVWRDVAFCSAGALDAPRTATPRAVTIVRRNNRYALRILEAIYFTMLALPFLVSGWLLLVFIVYPLTRPFDPCHKISGKFFRNWVGSGQMFNPFWSCKLVGAIPTVAPTKTVIVCNHLSNADAVLVGSLLPWEAKYVSKNDVKFLPFLGWAMWLVGDIFVGFREHTTAKDGYKSTNRSNVLAQCREYLDQNCPVMIFPEGWRAPTTDLLYFKDGAFQTAIAAKANILPMALAGTDIAWPLGEFLPDVASCYLTIGDYISTEGYTEADIPALKQKVADAIMDLKKRIDPLVEEERRAARLRRGVDPNANHIVPNAAKLYGRHTFVSEKIKVDNMVHRKAGVTPASA